MLAVTLVKINTQIIKMYILIDEIITHGIINGA